MSPSSAAQIQMFEALCSPPPAFSHEALLVAAEGNCRSGSVPTGPSSARGRSRADGIAVGARADRHLAAGRAGRQPRRTGGDLRFSTFGRAPAHFDPHEVELVNARLLHQLDFAAVADRLPDGASDEDWLLLRPNLSKLSDFARWYEVLHGDIDPPDLSHDERLFAREAAAAAEGLDWADGPWRALTEQLKAATGRKGRDLYHPLRLALTGRESGPEMAGLVERMGKARAIERLNDASRATDTAAIFSLAELM